MSDKYYKNPNEYLSRIVKRLITYDPETGELFWSIRGNREFYHSDSSYKRSVTLFHGKPALVSLTDGYRCGEVFGRGLLAHRVTWFLFHGAWPESYLDHIDGDRTNNRIQNLRTATREENARNAKISCKNTSGKSGVIWCKRDKIWNASISIKGVRTHLGNFKQKEDAIKCREDAEKKYGYHKNHGRVV